MTSPASQPAGELAERSLQALEDVIERGLKTFLEVGRALVEIRERKLYREQNYKTFEEYCRDRWNWSRQRSYQLMDAASVADNLSTMVDTPPPQSERQARELARLPTELQRQVWIELTKENPQPTAREIRAAVLYLLQRPENLSETDARDRIDGAKEWRGMAVRAAELRMRSERGAGELLIELRERKEWEREFQQLWRELTAWYRSAGLSEPKLDLSYTEEEALSWMRLDKVPDEFFEFYCGLVLRGEIDDAIASAEHCIALFQRDGAPSRGDAEKLDFRGAAKIQTVPRSI